MKGHFAKLKRLEKQAAAMVDPLACPGPGRVNGIRDRRITDPEPEPNPCQFCGHDHTLDLVVRVVDRDDQGRLYDTTTGEILEPATKE